MLRLENRKDLAGMVKNLKMLGTLALGLGRSIEFYYASEFLLESQLDFSNKFYWSLLENCKNVEDLGLLMADSIMEQTRLILGKRKLIKSLYLQKNQDLSIFYTDPLSISAFGSCLSSIEHHHLKSITLRRLLFVEDDELKRSTTHLEPFMINIENVCVEGFYGSTSSLTRFVPINTSRLKTFTISQSSLPTNQDLEKLISMLPPSLESFTYRLSSTFFGKFFLPFICYQSLPNLQSIELNGFTGITLSGFQTLLETSPRIQSISFANSTWIKSEITKKDFLKRFKSSLYEFEDLHLNAGVFPFSAKEMNPVITFMKKNRISLDYQPQLSHQASQCMIS